MLIVWMLLVKSIMYKVFLYLFYWIFERIVWKGWSVINVV